MGFNFWKRNSPDPLVKIFKDKYQLHLLSLPRENVCVGDLYVYQTKTKGLIAPGDISYFLENFTLPPIDADEILSDVSGTVSNNVDAKAGIGFLSGYLSVFDSDISIPEINTGYQAKGAKFFRFGFPNSTRDSVDMGALAKSLSSSKMTTAHALFDDSNRYYLTTAVVRSPTISVTFANEYDRAVDLNLSGSYFIEASIAGEVSRTKTSEGMITFSGGKRLVYAVELHELNYYPDTAVFRINSIRKYLSLKGTSPAKPVRRPAFIGDPNQGEMFLDVGSDSA